MVPGELGASGTKWNDLPPELLIQAANSSSGTGIMRAVSRSWRIGIEAFAKHLSIRHTALPPNLASRFLSLASLDLTECTSAILPSDLLSLRSFALLASLALPSLPPAGLEALLDLPHLRSLTMPLWADDQAKATLAILKRLSLTRLSLTMQSGQATEARLRSWEGLPLAELDLSTAVLSPETLALLAGMPLEVLKLPKRPPQEGAPSFPSFLRGKPLRVLDLGERNRFRDDTLELLRGMPLTDLSLGAEHGFTDEGIEALAGMRLGVLRLGLGVQGLSDVAVKALVTSVPVKDLSLWGGALAWGQVAAPRPGERLGLSDASVRMLKGMPLRRLSLACNPNVSSAGLLLLRGMPLACLDLRGTGVTDEAVPGVLWGLPLADLNLGYTGVTDRGLGLVREGMQGLDSLGLVGCSGVTVKGICELRGMGLAKLGVDNKLQMDPRLLAVLRNAVLWWSPKGSGSGRAKKFAALGR